MVGMRPRVILSPIGTLFATFVTPFQLLPPSVGGLLFLPVRLASSWTTHNTIHNPPIIIYTPAAPPDNRRRFVWTTELLVPSYSSSHRSPIHTIRSSRRTIMKRSLPMSLSSCAVLSPSREEGEVGSSSSSSSPGTTDWLYQVLCDAGTATAAKSTTGGDSDSDSNSTDTTQQQQQQGLYCRALAERALREAQSLRHLAEVGGSQKTTWVSLQRDVGTVLTEVPPQTDHDTKDHDHGLAWMAVSLYAALALIPVTPTTSPTSESNHNVLNHGETDTNKSENTEHEEDQHETAVVDVTHMKKASSRAAASALHVQISKCKWNHSMSHRNVAYGMVHALLIRSAKEHAKSLVVVDLNIVTSLAKAFGVHYNDNNHRHDSSIMEAEGAAAAAMNRVLTRTNPNDNDQEYKSQVAAVLALAAQLQPWNQIMSPVSLVQAAIPLDLWHQAELICTACSTHHEEEEDTVLISVAAVHALIDGAMEAKLFRRADTFATQYYHVGGQSRFLEARYLHACSTIAKVITKQQLPVIERQVARVDQAVQRVTNTHKDCTTLTNNPPHVSPMNDTATHTATITTTTTASTAEKDIRMFCLQQLEEAREVDGAHRLAKLFGVEYRYDPEKVQAAMAARRKCYLQWEEAFPKNVHPIPKEAIVPPPKLIDTPQDLMEAFQQWLPSLSLSSSTIMSAGPFGFDVEWGEDHAGAAVLQISTIQSAILIDIPTLSMSHEGAHALEETVGRLLNSTHLVVVGFACRQDLARLRSSPCIRTTQTTTTTTTAPAINEPHHWYQGSQAVVDLQSFLPSQLRPYGLSRIAHHYLGKPLDKAEQCSVWTARPLSLEQRTYAALDAWVCAAIYAKLLANQSEEQI